MRIAFFWMFGACIFLAYARFTPAQDLTLPIYSITIDSVYLDSLAANPTSGNTYPALLEYDSTQYECRVRYRGSSSVLCPKKSWKIYFEGDGPTGWEETNLNAEYRDVSLFRNYLSMSLARFLSLPTPDTRFISLLINGVYYGVYLEIEQVDEDFYDRRDLGEGSTFKAITHGARFAPTLYSENLQNYYEVKSQIGSSLDTLGCRITLIQYGNPSDIAQVIDQIVDADNVLRYFAVQYCISNWDGFSKNFYLHLRGDNRYILTPWDCDATFGNNWQGNYIGASSQLDYNALKHQALFQRLISREDYRELFLTYVDSIVDTGFDSAEEILESVYEEIRHDVYLDTLKKGTNEEFDEEFDVIENWMEERCYYLEDLDYFHRIELTSYRVTPGYITDVSDTIHFEAEVGGSVYGVQVAVLDSSCSVFYCDLNDNGSAGDSLAGDGIYSVNAAFPDLSPPFYYAFIVRYSYTEGYPTPPGGWYNFNYYPLSLPSIQLNTAPPQPGEITIGEFEFDAVTGTHSFALVNGSERDLDLSGCTVTLGRTYRRLYLPPQDPLAPAETLFVTNHPEWVSAAEPGSRIQGGFYFTPQIGDTVFLDTPSGTSLAQKVVTDVNGTVETVGTVVINEINYHSAEDFDPGDWIELYCREDGMNLGGWQLKDCHDDHEFVIPEGIILYRDDYLVLARYPDALTICFPEVENVIGGYYFGFNASGDDVRLYDNGGNLVDWVEYDDDDPWPPEADGEGATLELINPDQPNYGAADWEASSSGSPHGTPGERNSVYVYIGGKGFIPAPTVWSIVSVYPNPFNSTVRIRYEAPRPGKVTFFVFDIMGRKVARFEEKITQPGNYTSRWNGSNSNGLPVGSGMYFVRLQAEGTQTLQKVVLIK